MLLSLGGLQVSVLMSLLAVLPTSTNYSLKAYDLGGSGGETSSANYLLNGSTESQSGNPGLSSSYEMGSGVTTNEQSNVPPAPIFTNPNSYYDRLLLQLSTGNNPSDTKYAIAISNNNFTTTQYVKSDHSVGSTLTAVDYQTYTAWGGGSGFLVLGLQPGTGYSVKIKAYQGNFTESAYSPVAVVATVQPYITFTVATTVNPTPPFAIGFSGLVLNTVFSTDADASLGLSTNALYGGNIYIKGSNNGLRSLEKSYTIASSSADLNVVSKGYGAVVTSIGQTNGGPFVAAAPYNGAGNTVGSITSSLQEIAGTGSPISGATLIARIKAKTDINVPASTDYSDVLTFVAAMAY